MLMVRFIFTVFKIVPVLATFYLFGECPVYKSTKCTYSSFSEQHPKVIPASENLAIMSNNWNILVTVVHKK